MTRPNRWLTYELRKRAQSALDRIASLSGCHAVTLMRDGGTADVNTATVFPMVTGGDLRVHLASDDAAVVRRAREMIELFIVPWLDEAVIAAEAAARFHMRDDLAAATERLLELEDVAVGEWWLVAEVYLDALAQSTGAGQWRLVDHEAEPDDAYRLVLLGDAPFTFWSEFPVSDGRRRATMRRGLEVLALCYQRLASGLVRRLAAIGAAVRGCHEPSAVFFTEVASKIGVRAGVVRWDWEHRVFLLPTTSWAGWDSIALDALAGRETVEVAVPIGDGAAAVALVAADMQCAQINLGYRLSLQFIGEAIARGEGARENRGYREAAEKHGLEVTHASRAAEPISGLGVGFNPAAAARVIVPAHAARFVPDDDVLPTWSDGVDFSGDTDDLLAGAAAGAREPREERAPDGTHVLLVPVLRSDDNRLGTIALERRPAWTADRVFSKNEETAVEKLADIIGTILENYLLGRRAVSALIESQPVPVLVCEVRGLRATAVLWNGPAGKLFGYGACGPFTAPVTLSSEIRASIHDAIEPTGGTADLVIDGDYYILRPDRIGEDDRFLISFYARDGLREARDGALFAVGLRSGRVWHDAKGAVAALRLSAEKFDGAARTAIQALGTGAVEDEIFRVNRAGSVDPSATDPQTRALSRALFDRIGDRDLASAQALIRAGIDGASLDDAQLRRAVALGRIGALVRHAESSGRRIARLLDPSARFDARPGPVVALVWEVWDHLPALDDVSFHVEAPEGDSQLVADLPAVELFTVLEVLLSNALRATRDAAPRPDRRIAVHVARRDGQVEIRVEDNGVPMPPERRQAGIFAGHAYRTSVAPQAHGIGLPRAYDLVHRAGGVLTFDEAQAPWKMFVIHLPLASSERSHGKAKE